MVRTLLVQLLVVMAAVLTLYLLCLLYPQMQDYRKNMARPEFQSTVHYEKLKMGLAQLHRRWKLLRAGWLVLAVLLLILVLALR